MGGPPSKPKYSWVTDSAQVPWGKGEKNPDKGSEIESETGCLQSVGAHDRDQSSEKKDKPLYPSPFKIWGCWTSGFVPAHVRYVRCTGLTARPPIQLFEILWGSNVCPENFKVCRNGLKDQSLRCLRKTGSSGDFFRNSGTAHLENEGYTLKIQNNLLCLCGWRSIDYWNDFCCLLRRAEEFRCLCFFQTLIERGPIFLYF